MSKRINCREFVKTAGVAALGAVAGAGLVKTVQAAAPRAAPSKPTRSKTALPDPLPAAYAIPKAIYRCKEFHEDGRELERLEASSLDRKVAQQKFRKTRFRTWRRITKVLEDETSEALFLMAIETDGKEQYDILQDCLRRFPNARGGRKAASWLKNSQRLVATYGAR